MATIAQARTVELTLEKRQEYIVRFDIHVRIQHLLMMASFLLLAFSGLPQKFSDWAISLWWVGVWGGIDNVRSIHHFAAYVMVFACLYHGAYILFTTLVLKHPFPRWMLPTIKDVNTFFQDIRYYMGLSPQEPKFDRYNYREKFDYWAIFWGMPIMALSGFVLMFPVLVTKYLPGVIVPISLVAHSDEALLAVTWIFVVHFFFTHLAPHVFPLNTSIFTGRVPKERYAMEHPLEYEWLSTRGEESEGEGEGFQTARSSPYEESTETGTEPTQALSESGMPSPMEEHEGDEKITVA
jgi:cytochrome b subunit of formate dehydrogenase